MRIPSLQDVQRAVGDHYAVEDLLGQGGMGAVYRGRHRSLDSPVAIKVLPVPASLGSAELERFRREAMIAARLPHPNIVPVYEFDVREDLAFLIMPLVEGTSLDQRIAREGPLGWREVRRLLEQVGAALQFAHERDVVHRDIKPANILWEPSTGRWLVTDFGIARRIREAGAVLTATGVIVGTPAYMAPEQAAGSPVDRRADVYGLGAVAFEALTGTRPEPMTDASRAARDLKKARPELPPARVAALTTSLALDRDERPASVREWLDRLDATESRRGARTVMALATVAAVALAAVVWQQRSAPAEAGELTAVLPLDVAPGAGLHAALGRGLGLAIAELIQQLPGQRVTSVSSVEQALRDEFGIAAVEHDTAAFVASRFGAKRILAGQVRSAGEGRVQVSVQLRAGTGALMRADSAEGPTDSLGPLVEDLVVSVFAEGLAREQVGWTPVFPRGWDAIRSYLTARPRLRAGAYDEAVEHLNAVIAADSTFAPAYFWRTLAEVLRVRPTLANRAVRAALDAARRYQEGLDPATRDLLAAYQTLVAEGDLKEAHEQLAEMVRQHESAADTWFILGYVQFHFGPLFEVEAERARYQFEQAARLVPEFAAPHAFLAWIALAEERLDEARTHLGHYLAIDSTSVSAELVRLVDSIQYTPDPRVAARLAASFDHRPTAVLELIALAGSGLKLTKAQRTLAGAAIHALRERGTAGLEQAIAFRLEMAWLLGGARLDSAQRLLRDGRLRVPSGEWDAWTVLLAVTGALRAATDTPTTDAAASRLAKAADDPTAQWLAARWLSRDPAAVARGRHELRRLADAGEGSAILARSLLLDLDARGSLAKGDTAAAMDLWARATQRYQIEEVPFGLVASLWPLEVDRARIAAARGDHDVAARIAVRFGHRVGFMDQVARLDVLPLGIVSLKASNDGLTALQLADQLVRAWSEADGAGRALLDSVRTHLPSE
jgi:lipoprotein NlpI